MRISDWSSDVCSSDLVATKIFGRWRDLFENVRLNVRSRCGATIGGDPGAAPHRPAGEREALRTFVARMRMVHLPHGSTSLCAAQRVRMPGNLGVDRGNVGGGRHPLGRAAAAGRRRSELIGGGKRM